MFPMRTKNNAPSHTFSAHLERHVGRSRVPLPLGIKYVFLRVFRDHKLETHTKSRLTSVESFDFTSFGHTFPLPMNRNSFGKERYSASSI